LSAAYAADVRLSGTAEAPMLGPLQHGSWLGSELAFFLVGVLVADLWTTGELKSGVRRSSLAWDALWIAGFAAVLASYRALEETPWGIALLLGGLFLMALGAFRSVLTRSVLSIPLVSMVGGACYTIYLFHFLLVSLAGRFIAPYTTTAFEHNIVLIAVPFTIAITLACLCLFPFVERPFMFGDWPQRLARSVRDRSLAPVLEMFRGDASRR